jgi:ribosomal protein S18 acetylase RimI-like enzyme
MRSSSPGASGHDNAVAIRDYTPADQTSWLRCRVLSFLTTPYFDDVLTAKAEIPAPGFELVALTADGTVVGIMDVAVEGELATIDTVAVHPDHQHQGIGSRLLALARPRAASLGATVLDAWTRDQEDTLHWYRSCGFTESSHYLHVYADARSDPGEPTAAIGSARPGLRPLSLFLHATDLSQEPQLREQFARVHVCRRFAMPL